MKRADFRVVLDACVLAPANLCDLLLSLAESPRLYLPLWSEEILAEVRRTQIARLGFSDQLADSWQAAVRQNFPESIVQGYEPLIGSCQSHEKDRHVLAAAIKAGAELIVTSNLRHFPAKHLEPWGVAVTDPASYLITLYSMEAGVVVAKLVAIAARRRKSPQEVLALLGRSLPDFAGYLATELGWDLPQV
jgi:predicted nucleic acid-binding protein